MSRRRSLLAATGALALAGCATIISGTTQNMTVSSNVDGAEVMVDGEVVGTTPFTGPVSKNGSELRVSADGYRPENRALSKTMDPWFFGNIILGGTLGSITDFATGAIYQYAPASYQVDLRAAEQSEAEYLAEVAVRKFSMVYADEIGADIASGGGEYLSALVDIFRQTGTDGVSREQVVDGYASTGGDPVTFGRSMVALR